ncbi:MAG: hypothetical protein II825_03345 [Paludibacteraceae bacterium]|nr:hypothetical protein [Paludibacteraceae bacterium]
MRKILSIFAAALVAIAVNADPVVLPATLDVNNVSFRSEGMPDFVLAEGDYAGTYFDMGAHDSANDTLLYAQWDVTIEPIMYTVGVVVYNTNSWRVQLDLLNQSDEVVKAIRYKGSSGQCGQYGIGTLDLTDLAAGNYKVRVHAATAWSAMKLKDVIFVANYAGVNVDLPGTLLPAYAELSSGATVSNNAIAFAPSTANNEFATWNVTFAEAGNFDVTIDMTASNGHTYGVTLLSADGATEIGAVAEAQSWDTGVKALGSIAVPAAGSYKVKLTNATQWSEALLNSITFAAPAPAHTYTVAGSSTDLFGTAWSPAVEANDMTLVEGVYTWEKTDLTLAAGTIEFKVCEDHAWTNSWPAQNYQLSIAESGIYTITITFNADSKEVAAVAQKTGSAEVDPTVSIKGGWDGWAAEVAFVLADNKETATGALNIAEAGNYEFKVILNGSDWRSNGYTYHREFTGADGITGNGDNMVLQADAAGEYTITWTFATNALNITFPAVAPQPVDEWAEIKFTEPVAAADIAADATFTVAGSEFAMQVTDPDNKMVIDANTARFGTPEAFTDYTHRLKTSGKTNEGVTKNFMTLNIPEAGQLRIAVRTGSNSDATRTLIIKQGETELYNQVVKEDDKTVIVDGENSTNYYPYITVNVAAGSVVLSYPINGLNFYAFAFKAGGDAPVVLDAPDAAPTAPTYENYQVHAAYSATYNADCNFGEWNSGTVYTQEEFGKKYVTNGAGYFGLEFGGMNCSEMEALHLDVWIAADASIRIVPIHGGTEVGVTAQLEGQKWNSIDIALSEFEGVTNWSNVYQIKIDNASNLTFWLNNVYFYTTQEKTVDLVDGYYLIGNINGWDIHNLTADHLFAVNPANEAEYILHYTLAEGNEFKVVSVASNAIATWYPGEAGNYVVDFAHAGEKDIYFRPDYQGGEGWHAGCIYVAADENANPYETWFASGDSWNQETESYLEWDAEAQKATVHINVDKYGQWRAQVKYHGLVAEEGKCYHVALKLKSNNAISNVTIKYQDDKEMMYVNNAALEANVEYSFDQTAAGIAGGNGILVLDFGFAHAGDIIEIYDVVIEETECPQVEHTYTVAGGSDVAFGTTWDPANTANDMAMNDDGIYVWEQTELTLAAGNIEFKVCEDHAWTVAYPAQNYVLNIPEAGIYTVWIHFDPANDNTVTAGAIKTGDAVVIPTIAMHGNFTGSWADTENFTVAEGNATASLTLNLTAGNYEFGMRIGGAGNWTSNGVAFTRENNAAEVVAGQGNLTLAADLAGDYVFTWTFETNTLSIAFPIGDGIDNTAVEAKAIKRIVNGQLRIEMNGVEYNAQGQVVK